MKTNEEKAERCRCGREPEVNTELRGYAASLCCKCGTDLINFISRGKTAHSCAMNWNDLIHKRPFRNYVKRTNGPDEIPEPEWIGPSELPQRSREFFRGGPC